MGKGSTSEECADDTCGVVSFSSSRKSVSWSFRDVETVEPLENKIEWQRETLAEEWWQDKEQFSTVSAFKFKIMGETHQVAIVDAKCSTWFIVIDSKKDRRVSQGDFEENFQISTLDGGETVNAKLISKRAILRCRWEFTLVFGSMRILPCHPRSGPQSDVVSEVCVGPGLRTLLESQLMSPPEYVPLVPTSLPRRRSCRIALCLRGLCRRGAPLPRTSTSCADLP